MVGGVIGFLQEQKRYRILWWGFGSNLLNHLCGLKGFDAEYLLKNKANEEVESQCQELLKAYGETSVYWWWPWSKRVQDVNLSKSQITRVKDYPSYRLWYRFILSIFTSVSLDFYLIKWRKLRKGDEVVKKHKIGRTKNIDDLSHIHFLNQATIISDDTTVALEEGITISFGRKKDSIMQMSLKEALELFSLPKLLERLDSRLCAVGSHKSHKMKKKDYEEYFNKEVNGKFKELSLVYHPDTVIRSGGSEEDIERATEMQQGVNAVWKIMKNFHECATSSQASVFRRNFQYNIYAEVEVGLLHNTERLDQLNDKVLDKLWWISKVSRTHLTNLLEKFLVSSMRGMKEYINNPDVSPCWGINKVLESADEYIERYKDFTAELSKLYRDCQGDKDLNCIKHSVSKLLQNYEFQYKILFSVRAFFKEKNSFIFSHSINSKPYSLTEEEYYHRTDEYFVLPVVEYLNILFISKELAKKAETKKKKWFKSSKKQNSKATSEILEEVQEVQILPSSSKIAKTSQEIILEKIQDLSRQELHELCYYLMSYYCHGINKENLLELLQERFGVKEINKKEARDLVKDLIKQYLANLINEFQTQRKEFEDHKEFARKVDELYKKAQEVVEQQKQIREDHKRMGEQLKQLEEKDIQREKELKQITKRLDYVEKKVKSGKIQISAEAAEKIRKVLVQPIAPQEVDVTAQLGIKIDDTPRSTLEESSIYSDDINILT